MKAGKALYSILTSDAGVAAIAGTKVFPEMAEQNAAPPYVVYNLRSNEPSDVQRGPSALDTAMVEVSCYANSYATAIDLGDAVRTAIDRVGGTYNGVNVQSIQYMTEVMDFDEMRRTYRVVADYHVRVDRGNQVLPATSATRPDLYILGAVFDEPRIITLTDGTTFQVASDDHLIFANYASASGTGNATLRLPAVSGNSGREVRVKTGANLSNQRTLTIAVNAGDAGVTIDGNGSALMDRDFDGITLSCIGGQWYIIQRKSK